jgi:hypothetical protein
MRSTLEFQTPFSSLNFTAFLCLASASGPRLSRAGRSTWGSSWYSHVVYARPDLRYTTPLDVALLRKLSNNELYTLDWGCWCGFDAVWHQILTRR